MDPGMFPRTTLERGACAKGSVTREQRNPWVNKSLFLMEQPLEDSVHSQADRFR